MGLKGILFDLDGTLVDSLSTTFEAFNHGFTTCGVRAHTPQEIMKYFGPGEDKIFAEVVGPERAEEAYRACREYTDANLGRVPMHDGVVDLLEQIKCAGIPTAIVTGRSWVTTEMILNHHRMLDRFVTVIANDHVESPKPSPLGIKLALSRMKLEPGEIAYVGDSHVDIMAARAAGAHGIAALWDLLANREQLAKVAPHHWAEKPAQVWEYLVSQESG